MSTKKVSVDGLADAIMEGLTEYAKLSTDDMKKAVKKAGKDCTKDIAATASKRTGKYAKSWRSKTTAENSSSIGVTVYSPSRYQIAHLLENGHAKRGGGRVAAIPHIAPAEERAGDEMEKEIIKALEG